MSTKTLTQAQIEILKERCKGLSSWLKTDQGSEMIKIHRDHEKYFKENLSKKNLKTLQVKEFSDIYKTLWASNIWRNKDWYIKNKLLTTNTMEGIRTNLLRLLYDDDRDIAERYDEFKANVKGFGPSSLSEILHFVFPDKYCLWNDKPKTILPALNLDILPKRFFKSQISTGKEYFECVQALGLIKATMAGYGIRDFVDLDIMFLHIYDSRPKPTNGDLPTKSKQTIDHVPIDTHQSAQYHLLELGNMLGFLTYTPDYSKKHEDRKLGYTATLKEMPAFAGELARDSARNIDVIWFNEDENPHACFEVEHTTGISPGLHRLFQLRQFRVKFFIIASEEDRSKFEREVGKAPYRAMRRRFRFISYDELSRFFKTTRTFHELKVKLMGSD